MNINFVYVLYRLLPYCILHQILYPLNLFLQDTQVFSPQRSEKFKTLVIIFKTLYIIHMRPLNTIIKKAVILLFWLILWQVAARLIHNPIYFPSLTDTIAGLLGQLGSLVFWKAVADSLLRILAGFFAAVFAAYILALLCFRFNFLKDVLAPFLGILKSVPVAAIIILFLIWKGSSYVVFGTCFIAVFPGIHNAMMKGLNTVVPVPGETDDIPKMSPLSRFIRIYRPAYIPYLHDAISVLFRIGFGAGIAAEIIGLPHSSIGEQLYRYKIYLNTAGIFSCMAVILTLRIIIEKVILLLFTMIGRIPGSDEKTTCSP